MGARPAASISTSEANMPMPKTTAIALTAAASLLALAAAGATLRPDQAIRAATASVARTLCGEAFVSGLDPDRSFSEIFTHWPGIKLLQARMLRKLDRAEPSVTVSLDGLFESRAIYRGSYGCDLEYPGVPDRQAFGAPPPALAGEADPWGIARPNPVEPTDPRLKAALDQAFAEPPGGPQKATKAVVVVHEGRIVAERYAEGYRIDTPLRGFSVSKSVVNALIGILVRQGRLKLDAPAPVAAWASPSDPRHAVTIEELLRMTSGLDLDEINDGFDANSRMQFSEPDMAGYAERQGLIAAPGTRWSYSSPGYMILSRIVRDAVGGHAEEVRAFAERELFAPLGMRQATMAFDAVGTPVGSSEFYATARDWARFGLLYLNDGMVGDRRILPAGWAAFSASATPLAEPGYGAGFWTNLGEAKFAKSRVQGGMPADSYFASGSLGQRVVIAPAERFVIVRFGRSQDWPSFDAKGMVRLTAEVNAIVNGPEPR
jgi:CubicO group peptidase (beta-lactamase class C family)